jgi:phage-related protein
MIDQFKSRTESLQQTGDQAQQRVTLTGLNDRTVTYQFELSVCDEEPFENCWPTDSVLD